MQITHYRLNQKLIPVAAALYLAIFSGAALAEKHEHDVEQHGSHNHGAARLTIAATDDGLDIMLESPAANVFGFEHKAKSAAEKSAVHEALEALKEGASLFVVNEAAACQLEAANIESAVADSQSDEHKDDDHDHEKEDKGSKHEGDDHDHEKEDTHDKHEDEHDHKKETHDDHADAEDSHDDHGHDDHADEEDSHSDVEATWAYHCDKPAAVKTVAVKLFSAFPKGFETIDVEWITATSAGKVELKEDGTVSLNQ